MANRLCADLRVGTLFMALQQHGQPSHGLVHHSDRGRQYAAEPYRTVLEGHGIVLSMSRRGNCRDNAPIESLFALLEVEQVHQVHYRTRNEAMAALLDYLEIFYNLQRIHSGLGYRTAAESRAAMSGVRSRMVA